MTRLCGGPRRITGGAGRRGVKGLHPRLQAGHDLRDGGQRVRAPLADPDEALARVEEAVLGVALHRRREERVRDAEALLVVGGAADAERLREALDAGLLPAEVAVLAEVPGLRLRGGRLAARELVGEGVPDGARLHPLHAARDDRDVVRAAAQVHVFERGVNVAVGAGEEARRELDAGSPRVEEARHVRRVDAARGDDREARGGDHLGEERRERMADVADVPAGVGALGDDEVRAPLLVHRREAAGRDDPGEGHAAVAAPADDLAGDPRALDEERDALLDRDLREELEVGLVDGRHEVHADEAIARLGAGAADLAAEVRGRLDDAGDRAGADEPRAAVRRDEAGEAVRRVDPHPALHEEPPPRAHDRLDGGAVQPRRGCPLVYGERRGERGGGHGRSFPTGDSGREVGSVRVTCHAEVTAAGMAGLRRAGERGLAAYIGGPRRMRGAWSTLRAGRPLMAPLPDAKPAVVAVDMGYGHLRAATALADAIGAEVLHVDRPPVAGPDEERLWRRARRAYEAVSRLSQIPIV